MAIFSPMEDDTLELNPTVDMSLEHCPSPTLLDVVMSDSFAEEVAEISDFDQASTSDFAVSNSSATKPPLAAVSGLTEQILLDHNLACADNSTGPSVPFSLMEIGTFSQTDRLRKVGSAVPSVRTPRSKKTRRRGAPKKERQKAELAKLDSRRSELQCHRDVGHSVVEGVLRIMQMMAADGKFQDLGREA
eukprot:m.29968 g.29968  ORF g.29968 m.29968 type:complete len:190 (+) comp11993_c0_seq2:270-839(+)